MLATEPRPCIDEINHSRRAAYEERWLAEKRLRPRTSRANPVFERFVLDVTRAGDAHPGMALLDHERRFDSERGPVLMYSPYLHPATPARLAEIRAVVSEIGRRVGAVTAVGGLGEGLQARRNDVAYRNGRRFAPSSLRGNISIVFVMAHLGHEPEASVLAAHLVRDVVPLEQEMRPDRTEARYSLSLVR